MVRINGIEETKEQEIKDNLNTHKKRKKINDILEAYRYYKSKGEKLTYIYERIAEQCGMNAKAVSQIILNNRKKVKK